MNQGTTFLEIGTKRPGRFGVEAVVMDAQRLPTAVQFVDICSGLVQETRYFHRCLRVILAAGWNIEERFMSIAAGSGGSFDAGAGFQCLAYSFHISFAHQVNQRNGAYIGLSGSGG